MYDHRRRVKFSYKLELEAGRQLSNFQADGSCNPCQIFTLQKLQAHVKFYVSPEAATAAFSRGRQLSWNTKQYAFAAAKFEFIRKIIIIIIIIIIPLLLYYTFKKISNFFRA